MRSILMPAILGATNIGRALLANINFPFNDENFNGPRLLELSWFDRFLKVISRCGELIAFVMLASGCALGAINFFVTKHQFLQLKCYAKNSIVVQRESAKVREIDNEIVVLSEKLQKSLDAGKAGTLDPAAAVEKSRTERSLLRKEESRKVAQDKYDKAQTILEDSECLGAET